MLKLIDDKQIIHQKGNYDGRNDNVKKCLALLVMRESEIYITMKQHNTFTRLNIIKKTSNSDKDMGK